MVPPVPRIFIQKILKIEVQLKLKMFLWGLIDMQLKKHNGTLLLHITTAAELLYIQMQKGSTWTTMEECLA